MKKYETDKIGYKICHRCLNVLPIECFNKDKNTPDGLQRYCKECWKNIRMESRGREKANEYARNHHVQNREKERLWIKEYRKTEKGKLNDFKHGCKRRNQFKKTAINFSIEDWNKCKDYFKNKNSETCCAYCGKPFKKLEKDHFIPLSKGGETTINNIIPSCESCNSSKNDTDFFIWYRRQTYYSKLRENKILKYLNYDKNNMQQLVFI